MEICGPPSPPLRAAWKSLLKSETARMLPISVVHGQIDDERHLTCYFGMLSPTGRSSNPAGRWAAATRAARCACAWRRRSARLAPELCFSSARRTRSERVPRSWQ